MASGGLGGAVLDALVGRTQVDPAAVEDVIVGCVGQAGEQSFHIGRNCVLASRLPESVPAVSIDRQCGSSQQALQFAAQAVLSGTQDVVIAAGVESMTRVPMVALRYWRLRRVWVAQEVPDGRTLPGRSVQPILGR